MSGSLMGSVGANSGLHFGFDSASGHDVKKSVQQVTAQDRAAQSLHEEARMLALIIVSALIIAVSENQLSDDELASDRLDDLMLDAVEHMDDEDGAFWELLEASVSDAFESLGVDQTMVLEVFSDQAEIADSAIESAVDIALANLPDEGEPLDKFTEEFIYGGASYNDFDAVNGALAIRNVGGKKISYRGALAIRNGKRAVVNKRLPNQKVRLTVKQRANMKKLQILSQRGSAIKKRALSLKKGYRMGIYKK